MIDKIDVTSFILGFVLPIVLLIYELRKTRELDAYHNTFNILLVSITKVDTIISEITQKLLEFNSTSKQISESDLYNGVLERPFGEDVYIMDYFIEMHNFMNEKLKSLELIMQQISFQSAGFKKGSKSHKLLEGMNSDISNYIQENYTELLVYLRIVNMDRVIFLEDIPDFLPTEIIDIHGEKQEVIRLDKLYFKIDNLNEIMNHFNKIKFK